MLAKTVQELRARHLLQNLSSPNFASHIQRLIDVAAASATKERGSTSLLRPPAIYAGFDPTGPSLHLGHLAVLTALGHLQRAGMRPIALVGGATAMIGDPTGKSVDRPLLSREVIAANTAGIQRCLDGVLSFEDCQGDEGIRIPAAECVNNLAFYEDKSVLDFFREVRRGGTRSGWPRVQRPTRRPVRAGRCALPRLRHAEQGQRAREAGGT